MNKEIKRASLYFGCDPEIFFADPDGKVVGSEKVIPKGLCSDEYYGNGKIVLDGVQAEFNPRPQLCRAHIGNELSLSFKTLKRHLEAMGSKGVTASFRQMVEVDEAELASLSEKSRILGCMPSENPYDGTTGVNLDSTNYRKRSAGGHIHMGVKAYMNTRDHKDLVYILDAMLGNTCVMIDRDPGNIERRKQYGRAGEYRLPAHGLEYRTLSNFWLRAYPLMGFVMGVARTAVGVWITDKSTYKGDKYSWPAKDELLKLVDLGAVRKAINENDVDLAKANYQGVREFISKYVNLADSGLDSYKLDDFDHFIKRIDEKGLEYWFPDDPMTHWTEHYTEGHGIGWESFLAKQVANDKLKAQLVTGTGQGLGVTK